MMFQIKRHVTCPLLLLLCWPWPALARSMRESERALVAGKLFIFLFLFDVWKKRRRKWSFHDDYQSVMMIEIGQPPSPPVAGRQFVTDFSTTSPVCEAISSSQRASRRLSKNQQSPLVTLKCWPGNKSEPAAIGRSCRIITTRHPISSTVLVSFLLYSIDIRLFFSLLVKKIYNNVSTAVSYQTAHHFSVSLRWMSDWWRRLPFF